MRASTCVALALFSIFCLFPTICLGEVLSLSVIRTGYEANKYEFSVCNLHSGGARIRVYAADSVLQLKKTGVAPLRVWFTAPNSITRHVDITTSVEMMVSEFNINFVFDWVHLEAAVLGNYTCTSCVDGFFIDGKTGSGPWKCSRCPGLGLSVSEVCSGQYLGVPPTMCQHAGGVVRKNMHYLQCPPVPGDESLWLSCDDSKNGWVVTNDTVVPRSAQECRRLGICSARGTYRDRRIHGENCIACHDEGLYGMRGRAKQDSGVVGVVGWDKNATCECAPGHYYDMDAGVCVLCGPGFYSPRGNLNSSCLKCNQCNSFYDYGSTSCKPCPRESYWSAQLKACHSCPQTQVALLKNKDFKADWAGFDRETRYINLSQCEDAVYSANCHTPDSITSVRSTCPPGFESVLYSETADSACRPCEKGTYNAVASMTARCTRHQVCSGEKYVQAASSTTISDVVCQTENLTEVLAEYPLFVPGSYHLEAKQSFVYAGVSSPTLFLRWNFTTTITWPFGADVHVYQDSGFSQVFPGAKVEVKNGETRITITRDDPEDLELYYRSNDALYLGSGKMVSVRVVGEPAAKPVLLSYHDHRLASFSQMTRVNCTRHANFTKKELMKDELLQSWTGLHVKLPFVGVAPCIFSCRDGSEKTETGCVECAAGSYSSVETHGMCKLCGKGTYQPDPGKADCIACNATSYSDANGSTSCKPFCLKGLAENCAITGCHPATSFLLHPNESLHHEQNCQACPSSTIVTGRQEWTRYGVGHCYEAISRCNDSKLENNQTCKPDCRPGFFAEYLHSLSSWNCSACHKEISCRPGQYLDEDSCTENHNYMCRECEKRFKPFVRSAGSELDAYPSEACTRDFVCRQPGLALMDSKKPLYFKKTTEVSFINHYWQDLEDDVCIASDQEELSCASKHHLHLECRRLNLNFFDPLFQPHDYPETGNKTYLFLTCVPDGTECTESIGCIMGRNDVLALGENCSRYLRPSTRRRLLQDSEQQCPQEFYYDGSKCKSCPENKIRQLEDPAREEYCKCKAGYRPDEAGTQKCVPCQSGEGHFCPGHGAEICSDQHMSGGLNETCPCPSGTSTTFDFARELIDCIAQKSKYLVGNGTMTMDCPVYGKEDLTEFRRQSATILTPCFSECKAERYATDVSVLAQLGNVTCDCDRRLFRRWHEDEKTCLCDDGFFLNDAGQCQICLDNHYCVFGEEMKECSSGMISRAGSKKSTDCQCDRGVYISEDATCLPCENNYYCPTGKNRILCVDEDVSKRFACQSRRLWQGSVCPPGEFFDKSIEDFTTAVTMSMCTNGLDINVVKTGEKARLFINFIQWRDAAQEYQTLIINIRNIPGIALDQFNGMIDYFEQRSTEAIKTYGYNMRYFGLMAATFQLFCQHQPVMVVARNAAPIMNESSVQCAHAVADLHGKHFVGTAAMIAQITEIGQRNVYDLVSVYGSIDIFNNIYTKPVAHVTYNTYLDCEAKFGVREYASSELEVCHGSCREVGAILNVIHRAVFEDRSKKKTLNLDAPTQYSLSKYWGDAAEVYGWYEFSANKRDIWFIFKMYRLGLLTNEKKVLVPSVISENQHAIFVIPLRTWRFWPAADVGVVMGVCDCTQVACSLHFRRIDVLTQKMHATFLRVANMKEVCELDIDTRSTVQAFFHLNHLTILAMNGTINRRYELLLTSDTEEVTNINQDVVGKRNCEGCGAAEARMPDLQDCKNPRQCSTQDVHAVEFVTNCVQTSEVSNLYCRPRAFLLLSENVQGTSSEAVWTMSTIRSKTVVVDNGNELQRRILFDARGLAQRLRDSNAYMSLFVGDKFCTDEKCKDVEMRHFAVVSTSNFNGWSKNAEDDDDFVQPIDLVVALTAKDGGGTSGLLVLVSVNSTGIQEARVLTPFFLQSRMESLRATMALTAVDSGYKNLLGVKSRIVITNQDQNMIFFEFKCPSCDALSDSAFSVSEFSCACAAGYAPILAPCAGLNCHENSVGVLLPADTSVSGIRGSDPSIPNPDAYINRCEACGGALFCVDGTASGVSLCPSGTYAPSPDSSLKESCYCDNGTAPESRLALTNTETCETCQENEICNALTNTEHKAITCFDHSALTLSSRTQIAKTTTYECGCINGYYSIAEQVETRELSLSKWVGDFGWNDPPLSNLGDGGRSRVFSLKRHLCQRCPANFFCANNTKHACPQLSVAVEGSSSPRHCVCPRNYHMNNDSTKCIHCLGTENICLNNQKISCRDAQGHAGLVHDLCPCNETGFYRVATQGCRICPGNHYCPATHTDALIANEPVRCPLHSKSPPGSYAISNCTCRENQYKRAVGTGSRNFTCESCPPQHRCNGSFAEKCRDQHCNDDECVLKASLPQHEPCSDGFVPLRAVLANWTLYKRGFLFDDHPLSADYRTAHRQYEHYLEQKTEGTRCMLCPPGLCCAAGIISQCSTKLSQFLTVPMGARDRSIHLSNCPAAQNTTQRRERARVGLSACFENARMWSVGTKPQQYQDALQVYPAGAIYFENDNTKLDDRIWKYFIMAKLTEFHDATYTFAEADIHQAGLLSGARLVISEIDIARVLLSLYHRLGDKQVQQLFHNLTLVDAGTGVAFDALIPCVWAIAVNSAELYFPDGTEDGKHYGEAVVLVNGVVKSITALEIVHKTAKIVLHAWNKCQFHTRLVSDVPRVVFATHFDEIKHGAASFFSGTGVPDLLFTHRQVCAWSNEEEATCRTPFNGVAVSHVEKIPSKITISFEINALNKEELALFHELDLGGDLAHRDLSQECPKAMVPKSGPGQTVKTCQICSRDNVYRDVYFDFDSGKCELCHTASIFDCSMLGKTTPTLCSFTRDGGCA